MELAWLCGVVALLLASGGVLIWLRAGSGERRAASSAFLEAQLRRQSGPAATTVSASVRRMRTGLRAWDNLLTRAGMAPSLSLHLVLPALLVGVPGAVFVFAGAFAALAALVLVTALAYFRLWLKANARQRRMLMQLPAFLEGIVRLLTIGNSIGAAFQAASANVEQPLREVLERADSLVRSGKDIDAALRQVSGQYGLRELYLVAAVISVALRFGGRSDQVLDRMAGFMRDVEAAREELVALSTEVRMSAWILALLPIGLAAFIIMFNNALFMGMWHDPMGQRMLTVAAVLQVGGSYWLYRMARAV
jgi:tight adherence protein B